MQKQKFKIDRGRTGGVNAPNTGSVPSDSSTAKVMIPIAIFAITLSVIPVVRRLSRKRVSFKK